MQSVKIKNLYIQALRGLAIAGVVLIHTLPASMPTVFVRPFLNFSVGLFIFLSGILTSRSHENDWGLLIRKRASKVLFPYLFWSTFHIALDGQTNTLVVMRQLLMGGASAQMYFIVVYLQLILLAPLLCKWLESPKSRKFLYLLTPSALLLRYCLLFFGRPVEMLTPFFGTWLIFYLFGIEWKDHWSRCLSGDTFTLSKNALGVIFLIAAQILEALMWYRFGCYSVSVSQLKITSMLSSILICSLFASLPQYIKTKLSEQSILVKLGDASFGIYLSHMIPVLAINKLMIIAGVEKSMLLGLLEWLVVLTSATLIFFLLKSILPQRLARLTGYA